MKIYIVDNLFTEQQCDTLIDYYFKNQDKVFDYRDTFCLDIKDDNPTLIFFFEKINRIAYWMDHSHVDWCQIVRWPSGSFMDMHRDTAVDRTSISSIIYLNDDYSGGETYFKDGTIIKPKRGRALFFNGKHFEHAVKPVADETRFTVATWYKR